VAGISATLYFICAGLAASAAEQTMTGVPPHPIHESGPISTTPEADGPLSEGEPPFRQRIHLSPVSVLRIAPECLTSEDQQKKKIFLLTIVSANAFNAWRWSDRPGRVARILRSSCSDGPEEIESMFPRN
jgi:hypothetical protein